MTGTSFNYQGFIIVFHVIKKLFKVRSKLCEVCCFHNSNFKLLIKYKYKYLYDNFISFSTN